MRALVPNLAGFNRMRLYKVSREIYPNIVVKLKKANKEVDLVI